MRLTHAPAVAGRRALVPAAALALAAATLTGGGPAAAADRTCAVADSRPTVWLLDTDSGVPSRAAGGGCSVNDLIDDEQEWADHGSFVHHVQTVANDLLRADVLDRDERDELVEAAAHSAVGTAAAYETIYDGTPESLARWAYAGRGGFTRNADGTVTSRVGATGGFGTLWYTPKQFADFSLRLQFRDDAPGTTRGNSGVQVRFPALNGPVAGCPTTFNGSEQNNLSWIAVNCGHEIQINDSPEGGSNDPRKTGSVYGFKDIGLAAARPTGKGVWNDFEIRVVGQHYTVIRNGVVINEYENVPGVPLQGRPLDPLSDARGLVGHIGLQAHGSAPDVVTFRNVRVRDLGVPAQEGTWFDDATEALTAGDLPAHVLASLRERLGRAQSAAEAGSEARAIGFLGQYLARAENQVKDAEVRAALLAQGRQLLQTLREMDAAEGF
ncbi:3-keto-disaccharide hydrolase [Motilibacter aurantiacus]|uniref:3-keto-disaccharide hydrolase n=1 Tax=Motilibacter aurantiacus TaxID=2714955 RepID=UPI00140E88CE|nr:DUF1080 domain-containing protein [Motilibacter aurantiacus]NHC45738.1 DUF1080 domain-containing protein [Motilibacter aurantiacus]